MTLRGASYLSFDCKLGDLQPVVAIFTQALVLSVNLPRIISTEARRLNSQVDIIRDLYVKDLEGKF